MNNDDGVTYGRVVGDMPLPRATGAVSNAIEEELIHFVGQLLIDLRGGEVFVPEPMVDRYADQHPFRSSNLMANGAVDRSAQAVAAGQSGDVQWREVVERRIAVVAEPDERGHEHSGDDTYGRDDLPDVRLRHTSILLPSSGGHGAVALLAAAPCIETNRTCLEVHI